MSYVNPIWLEGQRKRWLRHDWRTWVKPEAHRLYAVLEEKTDAPRSEVREAVFGTEREPFQGELLELRGMLAGLRHELAAKHAAERREMKELRIKSDLAFDRFLIALVRRAAQQKAGFDPSQPRDDHGKWADGGGSGAEREDGDGMSTEYSAASKADILRRFGKWTAQQFVSQYCKGSINRELPGEFKDMTIADIVRIARGGDARARTCLKLLNDGRFRK